MMQQTARVLGALLAAAIGLAVLVPAAAATSGGESFDVTLVVSGVTGERDVVTAIVLAKGVFSGNGRLVEVPNLPGDPDNVARDDLVFAEGTLHVLSTITEFSVSVNPRSCRGNLTILQTTEIVGGTGVSPRRAETSSRPSAGRRVSPATRTGAAPSMYCRCTRRTRSISSAR